MTSAMRTESGAGARVWAGYLLGFALGGFFDGILLHQILQWHHLLLGIQTGVFREIRTQILADGIFHLLMYAIALAGVWSLWRSREAAPFTTKMFIGEALIGFGVWHVLDGVLSHWLLGIHRIKMDSPNPLFWDLFWFLVFGVAPLLIGWLIRRRAEGGAGGGRAAIAAITTAVLGAGVAAALPPRDVQQVAVLVRPSEVNRLLDGLPALDGGILWADRSGALWVLTLGEGAAPEALYRHGALIVTRSPAALGCLAFTRRAL